MRYELKIAARYLWSSGVQTLLVGAAVAIGIVAYTFMAALINGLADSLTQDVIGNLAHVTLEPLERVPRLLTDPEAANGETTLLAIQRNNERRPEIEGWKRLMTLVEREPEVRVVAPSINGSGFIRRGEKVVPVTLIGTLQSTLSAISDIEGGLVLGSGTLGPEVALIGVELADQLGVTTGQRLRLESDRGRERSLIVRGVFDVGSGSLNERVVYVDLASAQSLFELEGAVSRFDIKIDDIYRAPQVANLLAAKTGLEAENWIGENPRLQSALTAQGSTGTLIKIFSLLAILVGVASSLLLAGVRRKPEVGILRSFGVSRLSIGAIFLLQGLFLGLLGSIAGSLGGYFFCRLLVAAVTRPDGSLGLPVDPAQGEYGAAILFATLISALAAIVPARSASRVDPVEVIQQ